MKNQFLEKISQRTAKVGVVGLGYVGLPLVIEFCRAGFQVTGFDIDNKKAESLAKGESYIRHISAEFIKEFFVDKKSATATTDFSKMVDCDAILICVPTPLNEHREPDLKYVESTAQMMGPYVQKGQLVTLESTTYPGTTEEVLKPILEEKSGLVCGKDFMLAYSPEREDPNNKNFSTSTIPKVVGGYDEDALEVAGALYETVIVKVVPVSCCRTAEATKLMENIFRCVNIALVNELKDVFAEMDIDVWEVIRAASTKPFGFMPFYPGPGLGGHCIPIDPFYLTWKAREYGKSTKFIELAGEINTEMPSYVVQKTMLYLNGQGKAMNGAKVLLMGLAYKKNVDDDRESPTYVLWEKLQELGAEVDYYDPCCPIVRPSREYAKYQGIKSRTWDEVITGDYDLALISTAHDDVDYDKLQEVMKLIVDTRGVMPDGDNIRRA